MFPASRIAAGALALLVSSPAFAGAGAHMGGFRPSVAHHAPSRAPRPVVVPTSEPPAPKPFPLPMTSTRRAPERRIWASPFTPAPGPNMPHVEFRDPDAWRPRIIHVGGYERRGDGRRHGRGLLAVGSLPYVWPYGDDADVAPAYVPVETPVAAAYGEPPIVRSCVGPAVYHLKKERGERHAEKLPLVIYGVQPPCGAPRPAEPPVRAAY
jgi:hypothetical protein